MRARRKNLASDNESLHHYGIGMGMGPVPYDDDFDLGPNGIVTNTDRLKIKTYCMCFSNRFDDDIDSFDNGHRFD